MKKKLTTLLTLIATTQVNATPASTILSAMAKSTLSPIVAVQTNYDDFSFDSTPKPLFYRYQGHNLTNNLSVDQLSFMGLYWGANYYHVDTRINSSLLTDYRKSYFDTTNGSTQSYANGVIAHGMKQLHQLVFFDVFGGYGVSKANSQGAYLNGLDPINNSTNTAQTKNKNYTLGAQTFFAYPVSSFLIQGSLGYWYTQINQDPFTSITTLDPSFIPPVTEQQNAALTTKFNNIGEQLRLYYLYSNSIKPFVNAALLQVVHRSASRPTSSFGINVEYPTPNLSLANHGYSLGAGVVAEYKALRITPAYLFSTRGSTFTDNMVSLRIELMTDKLV
jgi:hypothetical protein